MFEGIDVLDVLPDLSRQSPGHLFGRWFVNLGWLWDSMLESLARLFDVLFSCLKKVQMFFFLAFLGSPSATQLGRGGNWEVEGIWRPSESGGPFSIIKMQSNRRERPFYRRVAKVGGTKYRKTHGSRAPAHPPPPRQGFTNT